MITINKVIIMGRMTKEADIKYTQGEKPMCIARYTLAVDRRYKKQGEQTADFITCVAFGKTAEFVEKYCHKGTKLAIVGHITTGSYTNRDGQKVFTTEVTVDEQEFAESKAASSQNQQTAPTGNNINDYVNAIPGIDESLPFA